MNDRTLLRRHTVTVYLLVVALILLGDQLWTPTLDSNTDVLIFISDTDSIDAGRGSNSVYRIGLDGRGMKRLVGSIPHGDLYLRISDIDCHGPSQSLVIASHQQDLNGFHHALLDGSKLHLDKPAAGSTLTASRQIALAPDGEGIIVSRQYSEFSQPRFGLVTGDLRSREYNSIKTPTAQQSYLAPDWSPDGRHISYIIEEHARDSRVTFGLAIAALDGSAERVIYETSLAISDVAWSPDTDWLAVVINTQIHKLRPDGSGLARLTEHLGGASSPRWSPDGEWISYFTPSSFPGQQQLYVMRADGSQKRRVTNIRGAVVNGCWI